MEPFCVVLPYIVTHEMWWVTARETRMEWTAKSIDLLRALWAEGHSTAEIGRRMGVTKNAIVGKAHRLDLPARPSPIRKMEASGAPSSAHRRKPAAVRDAAPAIAAVAVRAVPQAPQPQPAPRLAAAPAQVASAQVSHFPRASLRSCCWPIGEPGQREFRFCGCEAAPGKPYCAEHAAIAYQPSSKKRDEDRERKVGAA